MLYGLPSVSVHIKYLWALHASLPTPQSRAGGINRVDGLKCEQSNPDHAEAERVNGDGAANAGGFIQTPVLFHMWLSISLNGWVRRMTGLWRRDNCLPEVMIINAECINAKRCGQSCSRSLLFRGCGHKICSTSQKYEVEGCLGRVLAKD